MKIVHLNTTPRTALQQGADRLRAKWEKKDRERWDKKKKKNRA
jgi:hypothetical protein